DNEGDVRAQAAFALAEIADARTATPALLAAFKGSDRVEVTPGISAPIDFHGSLALALSEAGPRAIPSIRKALADEDRLVRAGAALALGQMSVYQREAAPMLSKRSPRSPGFSGTRSRSCAKGPPTHWRCSAPRRPGRSPPLPACWGTRTRRSGERL